MNQNGNPQATSPLDQLRQYQNVGNSQPAYSNFARASAASLAEVMTPEQLEFEAEFAIWEDSFAKWKETYANHSDQNAYKTYEKKFLDIRDKLLVKRKEAYKRNATQEFEAHFEAAAAMASRMMNKFDGPSTSNQTFNTPMRKNDSKAYDRSRSPQRNLGTTQVWDSTNSAETEMMAVSTTKCYKTKDEENMESIEKAKTGETSKMSRAQRRRCSNLKKCQMKVDELRFDNVEHQLDLLSANLKRDSTSEGSSTVTQASAPLNNDRRNYAPPLAKLLRINPQLTNHPSQSGIQNKPFNERGVESTGAGSIRPNNPEHNGNFQNYDNTSQGSSVLASLANPVALSAGQLAKKLKRIQKRQKRKRYRSNFNDEPVDAELKQEQQTTLLTEDNIADSLASPPSL